MLNPSVEEWWALHQEGLLPSWLGQAILDLQDVCLGWEVMLWTSNLPATEHALQEIQVS